MKILASLFLAIMLLASGHVFAQGSGEKKNPASKEVSPEGGATQEEAASPSLGFGLGGGEGGGLPFDLIQCVSLESDPDGLTTLNGKVRVESKDLNISCEQLKINNNTNIATAIGNPVKLDQPPTIAAQCRNLTYNLKTKSALLENDASIVQLDKNGQKTNAAADWIKIDMAEQSGGGPSKAKVSMGMRPGSTKLLEIKTIGQAIKANGDKKDNKPAKVNDRNMNLIPSIAGKSPSSD